MMRESRCLRAEQDYLRPRGADPVCPVRARCTHSQTMQWYRPVSSCAPAQGMKRVVTLPRLCMVGSDSSPPLTHGKLLATRVARAGSGHGRQTWTALAWIRWKSHIPAPSRQEHTCCATSGAPTHGRRELSPHSPRARGAGSCNPKP